MTKFGWLERIFARDIHPTIDLNLMWNQSTCLNASIPLSKLPIMMQIQIRATNMRWGGMILKSLQPCHVPMPNTTISHSWLSHYNCYTEMWWPNLDDWKRNPSKEANPTIELILIRNQSTCIEEGKPKNNNKIRQHEKTNPSFNSLSPSPLSNPLFPSNSCNCDCHCCPSWQRQRRMRPALSPPPSSPLRLRQQRQALRIPQMSSGSCARIIPACLRSLTTSMSNWGLVNPPPPPPPPLWWISNQ
jgi:hypothetical protein